MKRLFIALLGMFAIFAVSPVFAQAGPAASSAKQTSAPVMHRYLIQRTFPAGALDGLDMATKNKVNATNAKYHVKWVESYATGDKNMTFCIYEAPSEQAIRDAAKANGLPVDQIFAVPVTLMPHSKDVVGH
jgi:Nickel responsive protein SCO4226-like